MPTFALPPGSGRDAAVAIVGDAMRRLDGSVTWVVRIEPFEPGATAEEKARFFAMVGELAREMGDDPTSVRGYVLQELGARGADDVLVPIDRYSATELRALCQSLDALAATMGFPIGRSDRAARR